MNHNLDIQKLLLKVEASKHPEDKISILKQAIQIADANNDLDWGFDLRLDLIMYEKDTSHCVESFPAFAWLLNTTDSNPDMFNESDFLWQYKWMAGSARRNANISRPQVEAIMDDLKLRMQRNGYSNSAYYSICIYWFLFLGEIDEAEKYLKLRDEEPRDEMSHCPACELDTTVEIELIKGHFDQAIVKAHDLITKKLTCHAMPLVTFCNLAYYLAKADDLRADEYFIKAEEALLEKEENDTSLLGSISNLIYYLIKNDKDKAWKYFQKYADWEVGAEDATSFFFAKNVLPLLKGEEQKQLIMSSKLPYYRSDNMYETKELFDYYYEKAKNLAEKFDQRNGTNRFAGELNKILQ